MDLVEGLKNNIILKNSADYKRDMKLKKKKHKLAHLKQYIISRKKRIRYYKNIGLKPYKYNI